MSSIRELWRHVSVSPPLIAITRRRVALQWRLAGRPLPAPHVVKQQALIDVQRRYGLRTLVETGTFTGEMIHAMRGRFDRIVSIELSAELHRAAKLRFRDDPTVTLLQGDSGALLPEVLASLAGPALFWLDGHYMGEGSGRGTIDTPIAEELTAVMRHGVRGHAVLIDDARLFDGTGGYPRLEELRAWVTRARPDAAVEVADDIIRCVFDAVS
jgi:hypothetical protein